MALTLYWPWLVTLPLFGALGAYLARCAEAARAFRISAALSPALVVLFAMCLILPWGLYIDGFSTYRLTYFLLAMVNWAGIPAIALLVGASPFLRSYAQRAR